MSSYYRERRAAGLYSADEETAAKAAKKLDKEMQERQQGGTEEHTSGFTAPEPGAAEAKAKK